MSSLIFVGIFGLKAGRRVQSSYKKRNGEQSSREQIHYSTLVVCRQAPELPAELVVYSRSNNIIYPDHAVALVIAKEHIPPGDEGGDLLLDALNVAPFPGDPASDDYDAALPVFLWPLIFGLGTISGPSKDLPDGEVSFPVTMSECIVDKSKARWANVPIPREGSVINFVGMCSHVTPTGVLSVDIENIVFCSTTTSMSSINDNKSESGMSPERKCRKYSAYAPPRAPIRSTASSSRTSSTLNIGAAPASTESTGPTDSGTLHPITSLAPSFPPDMGKLDTIGSVSNHDLSFPLESTTEQTPATPPHRTRGKGKGKA